MEFKHKYIVTYHAVKQFQDRIYKMREDEIIMLVKKWLQKGEPPFEVRMESGQLTWTYRRDLGTRPVYIPVIFDAEKDCPVIPTIMGEESTVHKVYLRGDFKNKDENGGDSNGQTDVVG